MPPSREQKRQALLFGMAPTLIGLAKIVLHQGWTSGSVALLLVGGPVLVMALVAELAPSFWKPDVFVAYLAVFEALRAVLAFFGRWLAYVGAILVWGALLRALGQGATERDFTHVRKRASLLYTETHERATSRPR